MTRGHINKCKSFLQKALLRDVTFFVTREPRRGQISSKVKFLPWIARDKRVPRSALNTSKKSAKRMPWAHLTSRPRLSDKTIFKHGRITHNRPTKAPLERHVFSPPINYSDARDERKGRKWQVPKKFRKNQSAASSPQRCQTRESICSFGRRRCALSMDLFFMVC